LISGTDVAGPVRLVGSYTITLNVVMDLSWFLDEKTDF